MKKGEGKRQLEFDFPKIDELPFNIPLNTKAEKMKIVFPSNNFTQKTSDEIFWGLMQEIQRNQKSGKKFK